MVCRLASPQGGREPYRTGSNDLPQCNTPRWEAGTRWHNMLAMIHRWVSHIACFSLPQKAPGLKSNRPASKSLASSSPRLPSKTSNSCVPQSEDKKTHMCTKKVVAGEHWHVRCTHGTQQRLHYYRKKTAQPKQWQIRQQQQQQAASRTPTPSSQEATTVAHTKSNDIFTRWTSNDQTS